LDTNRDAETKLEVLMREFVATSAALSAVKTEVAEQKGAAAAAAAAQRTAFTAQKTALESEVTRLKAAICAASDVTAATASGSANSSSGSGSGGSADGCAMVVVAAGDHLGEAARIRSEEAVALLQSAEASKVYTHTM
jgi:hypothetical protein